MVLENFALEKFVVKENALEKVSTIDVKSIHRDTFVWYFQYSDIPFCEGLGSLKVKKYRKMLTTGYRLKQNL